MSAEGSFFSYPRGDVATSLRTLVDQLNRRQREAGNVNQESLDAIQAELEGQIDAAEALIEALESNVTTLSGQVTTNAGQITDIFGQLDELEGSGVTAQQAFVIGLVTAVDTVLGSVSNQVLQLKKQSETLAQAAITEIIRGREDGAAIKVEQAVRQTETLSLSSQITSLTADLSTTNASIVSEQTARAGADITLQNNINTANSLRAAGDSALATDITNLTTTVNGNTSQITILAASIDGVEGRFGVAINLNGDVVGLVQLDGTAAGSNFTVVADKFIVAQRDLAGGDPVPVFGLSVVGGTSKLALRGDMIADGTIVARTVAANAIVANNIAANAITSAKIAAGAITADKIAANAITADKITIGAVGSTQIASGAVGATQLASNAVGTTNIAAGAVTSTQIAANAVGTTQIAASAVGSTQIANASVGTTKIATGAVGSSQIATGGVGTTNIATGAVTSTLIAAGAVTSTQVADGAIGEAKIANAAIGVTKIQDGVITTDKLAANAVTATKIAAGTITADKIASGTITADKLAAGAIQTSRINSADFRLDINAAANPPYIRLTS